MKQVLIRVLAVHVRHVLQAELVELDALHPHAVDYLPGSHIHQHLLSSSKSYKIY